MSTAEQPLPLQMVSWIPQTFKSREAEPKMKLLKIFITLRLEYYCKPSSPFEMGEIVELENVQIP